MVKTRTSPAGSSRAADERPSERGFTLLELLVVLAIIGFAVSLIPGFLLRTSPAIDLDRATSAMADGLRDARGQAVSDNRDNVFEIDVERRQFRAGAAVPVQIGGDIGVELVTARSERTGETSGRIRFFPDGSATGGRVVLSLGGDRRMVEVDWLTGAISVIRDDR